MKYLTRTGEAQPGLCGEAPTAAHGSPFPTWSSGDGNPGARAPASHRGKLPNVGDPAGWGRREPGQMGVGRTFQVFERPVLPVKRATPRCGCGCSARGRPPRVDGVATGRRNRCRRAGGRFRLPRCGERAEERTAAPAAGTMRGRGTRHSCWLVMLSSGHDAVFCAPSDRRSTLRHRRTTGADPAFGAHARAVFPIH